MIGNLRGFRPVYQSHCLGDRLHKKSLRRILCTCIIYVLFCSCLSSALHAAKGSPGEKVVTVVNEVYYPNNPTDAMTKICAEVMAESAKEHALDPSKPKIKVLEWSSIHIPGGSAGRAPKLMALTGDIAADVMSTLWHETRTNISEGYLAPLNEYIGEDLNGNGWIDDDETIWPFWKKINKYSKMVATVDGKVYALPCPRTVYQSLVIRTDLFRAAGLDTAKPPRDWDEFFYMCQKLTYPGKEIPGARFQKGQRAIFLTVSGWQWIAWLWAAGGQTLTQYRTDLETGREYAFPELEVDFVATDPITGKKIHLRKQESRWKATFASEAGIRACEFFHNLCWQRWIRLPDGEPFNLTKEESVQGWAINPGTGERIEFDPKDVIIGVARPARGEQDNIMEMFRKGEVAVIQTSSHILTEFNVSPENLSFFPIPGRTENDPPTATFFRHMFGLNHLLAKPENKAKRDAAWRIISTYCGDRGRTTAIRSEAEAGYARFMNPSELEEAGLEAYIPQIPKHWVDSFPLVETHSKAEPYMGFWWPVDLKLSQEVLDFIMADEDFDYATALKNVQEAANTGMMFNRTEKELKKYRPISRILFCMGAAFFIFMAYSIFKSFMEKPKERLERGSTRNIYHPALPWIMMAPALISILLWSYYPLARGSFMAFQDYHILKPAPFVGLDNFINVFLDPEFWMALRQTIKYVAISLSLTFLTPIFLAILLHEVPAGKIFFRTLYFLPQVTSSIVVMMIWVLLYHPAEYGVLNQIILWIDKFFLSMGLDLTLGKQDWLGDPRWAMIAVVIPSMWASAGISSLIYLAALKSIDEESYEAAEIEGAGIIEKIRYITIPYLKPLIIINFVAAFIGTFQNMENILVMTGGGPAMETMVISLRIWLEAYAFLRYSRAVVMAWILGLVLIAFTVYQLRILKKVEFHRAKEN